MKRLLLVILPLLLAANALAANPPYEAFLGTNGIIIRSNPPSGKILVDGAFITNGASAVFVTTNLFVVNNTYTSNLFTTNIFVDQSIITSNFFTINNYSSNITTTNIFVNQTIITSNLFATNIVVNTIIGKDILWTNDNGTVRLIDQSRVGIGTNSSDAMWILEAGTNVINAFSYATGGVFRFVINSNGEPSLIRGITYSWPSAQGSAQTVLTNDGAGNLGWGAGGSGGGGGSGSTNFMNLSVQAAKMGFTNYPAFNNGYEAWETSYYETNAEGQRAVLEANWQFMVPDDYATNSLQLLINYSLVNTNGPNTSNVIWGASVLVGRSGTTNNIRTNLFGFTAWGTNEWIAKYDGTNYLTNLVISLGTNAAIKAGDLSVIKIKRDAINDTYGGAVSIHGLQLKYTRP